nr:uncharacterized protein LOC128689784 [Cherax quadricarinatus]XP_053634221.1 uncharacterized protein LOC128689784 [Cherax quadricarinatus]XP_053634223.1 uncharacterized protein LOC128689784 [Cherax quadricarinatus]
MDMFASANNVILSTKSTVDNFSTGLSNLADSVGTAAFLVIVAGAMVVSAGLGGLSITGLARMDEYLGWPLWSRIFPNWQEELGPDQRHNRGSEAVSFVLRLLTDAVKKYERREKLR